MTPIRRQYLDIKRQHPDAILFFRLGDFYETFDADAETAARELDIVLTGRDVGGGRRVPMAGIPYHAAEGYIAKLVARGYRVAVCEQIGEPNGKGPVERRVTHVISPGTVVQPDQLAAKHNNFLAAVARTPKGNGLAYLDLTTAEFATCTVDDTRLLHELERLRPAEILVADADATEWPVATRVTRQPDWLFDCDSAADELRRHFEVAALDAYGCADQPAATAAAAAIIQYVRSTQPAWTDWITSLHTYAPGAFMSLDAATRRNLELTAGARGSAEGSLLDVLDRTGTPMGGRRLRRWVSEPLLDRAPLEERQAGVAALVADSALRAALRDVLGTLGDVERLTNRLSVGVPAARNLVRLRATLERLPALQALVAEGDPALQPVAANLDPQPDLAARIAAAIVDDPPGDRSGLGAIRPGYSADLDGIRSAGADSRTFIAAIEQAEREQTGMRAIKVGYNKVFGYYLEVSQSALRTPLTAEARRSLNGNGGLATMQDYLETCRGYQRKQTLVGAERYITPELKEREAEVATAQERARGLEEAALTELGQAVAAARESLLRTAGAIARLDVLAALAEVAADRGWCRPELSDGTELIIRAGRHPVVEKYLPAGEFVPNDLELTDDARIILLTGPNMAGKSTYLRQAALIVLLAQIGSFVPADAARIGLADRIFTRIGAQDDIVVGQSTFLVEMTETAAILNHATPRSLVILDEIGRGTSTYDGLAIAQAVVEYLHSHPGLSCRTLFATHYHELTAVAESLPKVANFHVEVLEEDGSVVFLHQVAPGAARRSYGIEVARLAGVPRPVVHRAEDILDALEGETRSRQRPTRRPPPGLQLPLFHAADPIVDELRELDVLALSPLEALNKLYEFAESARARTAT